MAKPTQRTMLPVPLANTEGAAGTLGVCLPAAELAVRAILLPSLACPSCLVKGDRLEGVRAVRSRVLGFCIGCLSLGSAPWWCAPGTSSVHSDVVITPSLVSDPKLLKWLQLCVPSSEVPNLGVLLF